MTTHTCTDCRQPITNGQAVIRSVSFEQVAFHRLCWQARSAVAVAPVVPMQRRDSLSERLAIASVAS